MLVPDSAAAEATWTGGARLAQKGYLIRRRIRHTSGDPGRTPLDGGRVHDRSPFLRLAQTGGPLSARDPVP